MAKLCKNVLWKQVGKMKNREIIGKVLSPAVSLWLRSQVEEVKDLDIKISGRNRDILTGYIPLVSIKSSYAVYQGIHVGQVSLQGENIRVNLGQVIKGQALRLLESVLVEGQIALSGENLRNSLLSPLLSQGLTDLLLMLLKADDIDISIMENYQINWTEIAVNDDKFTITGNLTDKAGQTHSIMIRSGLALVNSHTLLLNPVYLEGGGIFTDVILNNFEIDLGSQVNIEELILKPEQLFCHGRLTVMAE